MPIPLTDAITLTVGGLLTLGIYTFPFKMENIYFRIVESIYLGVSIGWIVINGITSLIPMLTPLTAGTDYLLIVPLILGFLLYTSLTSEYRYLGRFGTVVAIGTLMAMSFRTQPLTMLKYVLVISNPLDSITRLYQLIVFIFILIYFIFTIAAKPASTSGKTLDIVRRIGRIVMVMYIASYFVSWGTKRFSLIGYRVTWIIQTWLKALFT